MNRRRSGHDNSSIMQATIGSSIVDFLLALEGPAQKGGGPLIRYLDLQILDQFNSPAHTIYFAVRGAKTEERVLKLLESPPFNLDFTFRDAAKRPQPPQGKVIALVHPWVENNKCRSKAARQILIVEEHPGGPTVEVL